MQWKALNALCQLMLLWPDYLRMLEANRAAPAIIEQARQFGVEATDTIEALKRELGIPKDEDRAR